MKLSKLFRYPLKCSVLFAAPLAALALLFSAPVNAGQPAKIPMLLELFTSEGCSSCPPADRLMSELLSSQPFDGVELIGLAQHVDYWNRLGWKDPYSSAEFSQRQRNYSRQLANDNGVYTPQIVVHGKLGAVGSRAEKVFDVIDAMRTELLQNPPLPIPATLSNNGVEVFATIDEAALSALPDENVTLTIALVQYGLSTNVKSGENSGRVLKHDAVARVFHQHKITGNKAIRDSLQLPVDKAAGPLRVVVVAQHSRSGRVLAVSQQSVRL